MCPAWHDTPTRSSLARHGKRTRTRCGLGTARHGTAAVTGTLGTARHDTRQKADTRNTRHA